MHPFRGEDPAQHRFEELDWLRGVGRVEGVLVVVRAEVDAVLVPGVVGPAVAGVGVGADVVEPVLALEHPVVFEDPAEAFGDVRAQDGGGGLGVVRRAQHVADVVSIVIEARERVMSRVQLALRVSDLEESVKFYTSLFGVEPAKRRPGYANFAVVEPPLKLVLLEGDADRPTVMDHLGVEVETTGEVDSATERLSTMGLFIRVEDNTTCCYARQDKVWVHGPGSEPWEVYTVKEDSQTYGVDGRSGTMTDPGAQAQEAAVCCAKTGCTPACC